MSFVSGRGLGGRPLRQGSRCGSRSSSRPAVPRSGFRSGSLEVANRLGPNVNVYLRFLTLLAVEEAHRVAFRVSHIHVAGLGAGGYCYGYGQWAYR